MALIVTELKSKLKLFPTDTRTYSSVQMAQFGMCVLMARHQHLGEQLLFLNPDGGL